MVKYAYVTVLYGNNIYLTGALVLGYSLMKTNTPHDRIIMITPDVSTEYISYLKEIYTHIIPIDYLRANENIFLEKNTRFIDVFTKLQCLTLIDYAKIIMLDLDMIIAKNIDHLFELNSPAACIKKYDVKYGRKIPSKLICRGNKLVGSINAGLMLLEPSLTEYESIVEDISKNEQIFSFKYPEQDYLSLRYCDQWTSIPFNYNFQFGLTKRVRIMRYKIHAIYVIHYSSSYKPWYYLIDGHVPNADEANFIDQHQKYFGTWRDAYTAVRDKYNKNGIVLPY